MADRAEAAPAEGDVVLRDGTTIHVRPVHPGDAPLLERLLRALSGESRRMRFMSVTNRLAEAAGVMAGVDEGAGAGLLALAGGAPVGHAEYIRTGPDGAEVAFEVAERLHGHGLATILLGQLAYLAHRQGISTFTAEVLADNHPMVSVLRDSGFPVEVRAHTGVLTVHFPTSLTPEGLERFERRERIAAAAALEPVLRPRSVAVVGASRQEGKVGSKVLRNVLAQGFTGPVYPVNPHADVIHSVPVHRSLEDVPGPVDLAVIAVPAALVVEAARACARKGVRALVVLSAGFDEVGEQGAARQRDLLAVCRAASMRLVGPNCLGVINTAQDVRLDATFARGSPEPGNVGFASQSGALGLTLIDLVHGRGLGLSTFVSTGNKADISGNDLLHWWEGDQATSLVLLYLESFGNPRRFARLARRVSREKPIVAVKSGRSKAGARATASHTGAMLAAGDVTVDALFHQAGVIRTDTTAEMLDVAALLATSPAPEGPRVGIVTNAGGLGTMCADACEAGGLEVPPLPGDVRDALAGRLLAEAAVGNPVDLIASAPAEHYRQAIEVLGASDAVDALVAIYIEPLDISREEVAAELRAAADALARPLPLAVVLMVEGEVPAVLRDRRPPVPVYPFPEDAAKALARAWEWSRARALPEGEVPALEGLRSDEAAATLAHALAGGEGWLDPAACARVLDCYGIPLAPWRLAATPEEAAQRAEELGGAVALKAVAPGLVHKTDAGAVRLGLEGSAEVTTAARAMADALAEAGTEVEAFLVQRMAEAGVEMLVGVAADPSFGPVLACGAGGTTAELMGDVAVRLPPLTDSDACEMVRSLRSFVLLRGHRGAPPADVAALEDVVLRVGALVEAHPEIAEMDCNPVIVGPAGATVVDARIRIEQPAPRPLPFTR